jgi:16S rRNA (guanine(966)-N(2))-methyltransferase RsmD
MRIIAGEFKGRRLQFIKTPGIRPAMDRVKESLFNVLGGLLMDKEVLDLFAGSGSIGLEAISRGASRCVFVDKDRSTIGVLKENIEKLGLSGDRAEVLCLDWKRALKGLREQGNKFDFLFIDPPYKRQDIYENVLLELLSFDIVREGARAVVEHESRKDFKCWVPPEWEYLRTQKFGQTSLSHCRLRNK